MDAGVLLAAGQRWSRGLDGAPAAAATAAAAAAANAPAPHLSMPTRLRSQLDQRTRKMPSSKVRASSAQSMCHCLGTHQRRCNLAPARHLLVLMRAERGSIGASSEGEGPAEEADEEGSTATDEEDEEEDDDEEYELNGEHRSLSSVVKTAWAGAKPLN